LALRAVRRLVCHFVSPYYVNIIPWENYYVNT
jgi:hypothetical protein